jgi:hypothetical protein
MNREQDKITLCVDHDASQFEILAQCRVQQTARV